MSEIADTISRKIAALKEYRYVIDRYVRSLGQLVVAAYPMKEGTDPVYIVFRGVKYMQMPTHWEAVPFARGTDQQCQAFMKRVGMEVLEELPKLYYAPLSRMHASVVCGDTRLFAVLPKELEF